jgi:hypothetical protein
MYNTGMAKSSNRGIVNTVKLKSAIVLNGHMITKAIIELDHINYGLNSKNKKLNTTKRSNFSNSDVEKFLMLLDGEDLAPERYEKTYSVFMHFIKCPVKGKFEGREFVMIFKTDYHRSEEIHTITLYPNW